VHETTATGLWASALGALGAMAGRQCTPLAKPLVTIAARRDSQPSIARQRSDGHTPPALPAQQLATQPSAACNASRGEPYAHPPPRGGTPCIPLFGSLVCCGHVKARLRGQFKSTYYHFFYAVQPQPPYAITNVSFPFRFATLGRAALGRIKGELGGGFTRKATSFVQEKIQFASGLVLADDDAAPNGAQSLIVSWGVADCAGAARRLNVRTVGAMLERSLRVQTL